MNRLAAPHAPSRGASTFWTSVGPDIAWFAALTLAGAGARVALADWPNFAPVAAIALFGGYVFRHWPLALITPLAVMALSDIWIDQHYDGRLLAVVYGSLAAPALLRWFARAAFRLPAKNAAGAALAAAGLLGCALLGSLFFFFSTNLAVWLLGGMYEPTGAGLLRCYTQALPFFRYTLAGDACFGLTLFGGWALAAQLVARRQPAAETRPESP